MVAGRGEGAGRGREGVRGEFWGGGGAKPHFFQIEPNSRLARHFDREKRPLFDENALRTLLRAFYKSTPENLLRNTPLLRRRRVVSRSPWCAPHCW